MPVMRKMNLIYVNFWTHLGQSLVGLDRCLMLDLGVENTSDLCFKRLCRCHVNIQSLADKSYKAIRVFRKCNG